jgi:hypothetical protein
MQPDHNERHRREGYRVQITPGLWRGYDVSVEPPTSTHVHRHFATHELAMEAAREIERTEGWPVTDKTGAGA